ncbi:hypothetical protein J437_LFUL005503 [Ladona fulva]|uniref:Uncharacterized protein n=1 Tax=Ladona fulva TaxID=123851 RepID=A0A8K0K2B8_LADFU|nr:hypothetical protein J437_LFUL005503 [Ladona fulva]
MGLLLNTVHLKLIKYSSGRGLLIPPVLILLTALRFYSTGSYQVVYSDIHGISHLVSRIFGSALPDYMRMPETACAAAAVALQF